MNDTYGHINELLEDTSFPPIVLLDGKWGEGKTYYTENILIPELTKNNKNCVFFSLTGLSSISDFKDRLLSTCLLNEQLNSDQSVSINKVFSSLLTSFGSETVSNISSILSGATGLIKESLLSRIKNKYILIDDLDRVDDGKLCDLIIGECLQLVDSKNNLKFIFIVNNEKCKAGKHLKEKVFSGIVKLNRSISDSIKIAFVEYEWFETYKDQILKVIETKKMRNLRVLKRCSRRINSIYNLLKADTVFDEKNSMSEVINGVLLVSYYHYEEELNESQIKESAHYTLKIKDKKVVNKYLDLQNINYFLTDKFISYCIGGAIWNISLNDFGRLPKKACPIDSFIFKNNFDLNDTEFDNGLSILSNYIFEDKNVEFSKWFEAAYYYYILQERHFISDDKIILEDSFKGLFATKTFDYSELETRHHRLKINDTESFIYKNHENEKKKYYEKQKQTDNDHWLVKMSKSWSSVDKQVYEGFRSEEFFNKFTIEQLKKCLKNWQNHDLALFSDFIDVRFKDEFNQKNLKSEIDILSQLYGIVEEMYETEPKGRRKGSLYTLVNVLKTIN
jgi:hypothetical protein